MTSFRFFFHLILVILALVSRSLQIARKTRVTWRAILTPHNYGTCPPFQSEKYLPFYFLVDSGRICNMKYADNKISLEFRPF